MAVSRIIEEKRECDIGACDLNNGDYAVITKCETYPEMVGKIVVCYFDKTIVGLDNPAQDVWDKQPIYHSNGFRVRLLPKGTKIEIIV